MGHPYDEDHSSQWWVDQYVRRDRKAAAKRTLREMVRSGRRANMLREIVGWTATILVCGTVVLVGLIVAAAVMHAIRWP